MKNKFVFGLIFCQFIGDSFCGPNERRLIKDLLQDYEPYERPVYNESAAVDLKHGLTILKLDLDVDTEILTGQIWMNMEWNDANLRWNPADYGGIDDIRLPSERIWIPDIIPYNALDYHSVDPRKQMTNIVVSSSGGCTWIPPIVLKTMCKVDDTSDTQSCDIKVGSWTYNGFKINLIKNQAEADTSTYVRSKEWDLIGTTAERHEVLYPCCPEPYFDTTYNIKLKKRGYTLKSLLF